MKNYTQCTPHTSCRDCAVCACAIIIVHYALEPIKTMIFVVNPVRLFIKEILVEHINSDASKGTIKI